jgi:vitamin K-dependent gamma-carboxylase
MMLSRFRTYLQTPINGQVLGLFRVVYSLFMTLEMVYYLKIDLVRNMFVLPSVNFKYDGLAWLTPMSGPVMTALVWVLLGLSLMMASGVWFKWAARLFAIGNAYIFFLDTSLYNNHIYLYILVAWMLSCTHADQFFSLGKKTITLIPRWEQFVFQLQMVIVYFYAGVIKFKYDWLVLQEPVRSLSKGFTSQYAWFSSLVKTEAAIQALTYGGLLLDILSPLLLWYKPVRKWAIYIFIGFHLFNSNVFDDIAFFPFVMLGGLVVFYEPQELGWLKWVRNKIGGMGGADVIAPPAGTVVRSLFVVYFVFQILFPFRGFLLPNEMDWTSIGNRFSWRVKGDSRGIAELAYQVYYTDGKVANVDVNSFINTHQIKMLSFDPRASRDLALAIKSAVVKQGGSVAAVKARLRLSCNGRPAQYFINPESDLTRVTYSPFKKLDWVIPQQR